MKKTALVFAYQEVGVVGLEVLVDSPHWRPAAVVTHRDDPGENRWYRSVADTARGLGLPVHLWEDMARPDLDRLVADTRPDAVFSVYFRKMLPVSAFKDVPLGAYNLHGSLLPAYRGCAPVNWVLVRGEERTGVTLHHLIAAADAGDVVCQEAVEIAEGDTALGLYRKMLPVFRSVLEAALPGIAAGDAPRVAQDAAAASYFGRRGPEDGRIDWTCNAWVVDRLVRAVTHPYPGAFTGAEGRKLVVWAGRSLDRRADDGEPGQALGVEGDGFLVRCGTGTVGRTGERDRRRLYRVDRCALEGGAERSGREIFEQALSPGTILDAAVSTREGEWS